MDALRKPAPAYVAITKLLNSASDNSNRATTTTPQPFSPCQTVRTNASSQENRNAVIVHKSHLWLMLLQ